MKVQTIACAKINLTLDVTRRLVSGYHDLRTIMQSVSLFDTLTVETTGSRGVELFCSVPDLPSDGRNAVVKAAQAFYEITGERKTGLKIQLEKNIPVAAGLAGGSTDAAAVLRALDVIHSTNLGDAKLRAIGATVGSDVPFCISGGAALVEGVGDRVTPVPPLRGCALVLVKPAFPVSTAEIFSKMDSRPILRRPDTDTMLRMMASGDVKGTAKSLYNVMEETTGALYPEIGAIEAELMALGAYGAVMSGSGPTVFAILPDMRSAHAAVDVMLRDRRQTFAVLPCPANSLDSEKIL